MLVSQRYPFLLVRCVLSCLSIRNVSSACLRPFTCALSTLLYICLQAFCMLTFFFLILSSHIKNMLKLLYNGFVDLYGAILPQRPSLASEHALRQEQEIYERTTKSTYPNVIFLSCSSHFKQSHFLRPPRPLSPLSSNASARQLPPTLQSVLRGI